LIDALKSNLGENHGLYIFPGLGVGPEATREEKHAAMQKAMEKGNNGPSGLLIYHPLRPFVFSRRLTIQFATHLAEAILAVFLLSLTRLVSFGGRVGFVLVAGILAAITTNIPYLNWYGFPRRYTASSMFIEVV